MTKAWAYLSFAAGVVLIGIALAGAFLPKSSPTWAVSWGGPQDLYVVSGASQAVVIAPGGSSGAPLVVQPPG